MTNNRGDENSVYRGYPHQVQLDINDTPLTRALINGDFKSAEKIIVENSEEGFLDEGPFGKIPLALVLSSDSKLRTCPRHLRLAKLLAERGADVNGRILQLEWQGATSPMQYLVELFMRIKGYCRNGQTDYDGDKSLLYTIGLHDEEDLTALELKDQLLELLDVFLACGGNPNVTTPISNCSLYHMVLIDADPDVNLVMKLCEAGGDLNQNNVHGTTPLMDLIMCASCDASRELLKQIWEKQPNISSLDMINCSNETTLWRAMHSSSPQLAIELLEKGADPTPRATVSCGKWHSRRRFLRLMAREIVKSGLSAIFAPLLQSSVAYMHFGSVYTHELKEANSFDFTVDLFNKVCAVALYPVIDNTYFSESFPDKILLELERISDSETRFPLKNMIPQGMKLDDVALLMFGNVKAGLQQMCVRRIMKEVFFSKPPQSARELTRKLDKSLETEKRVYQQEENWDEVDFDKKFQKEYSTKIEEVAYDWEVVQDFTPSAIQCLVQEHLNLPCQFVPRFQIEAARLQLGFSLYTLESIDCLQGCDGESDTSSDDLLDDFDEDYDDDDDDDDDDESSWGSGLNSTLVFAYCFGEQLDGWGDDSDDDDDDDEEEEDDDNNDNGDENNENDDKNKNGDVDNDMDFSSSESDDLNISNDPNPSGNEESPKYNEDSSNGSGDSIPKEICRKVYEVFNDDIHFSDSSLSDNMEFENQDNDI